MAACLAAVVANHGSKGGLLGGVDLIGFGFGGVTSGTAAYLTALMTF